MYEIFNRNDLATARITLKQSRSGETVWIVSLPADYPEVVKTRADAIRLLQSHGFDAK